MAKRIAKAVEAERRSLQEEHEAIKARAALAGAAAKSAMPPLVTSTQKMEAGIEAQAIPRKRRTARASDETQRQAGQP